MEEMQHGNKARIRPMIDCSRRAYLDCNTTKNRFQLTTNFVSTSIVYYNYFARRLSAAKSRFQLMIWRTFLAAVWEWKSSGLNGLTSNFISTCLTCSLLSWKSSAAEDIRLGTLTARRASRCAVMLRMKDHRMVDENRKHPTHNYTQSWV